MNLKDPIPIDLLPRSSLVRQELSRMNINVLSLLDKTVEVTLDVIRMLSGFLEREITIDDPEWTAAIYHFQNTQKSDQYEARQEESWFKTKIYRRPCVSFSERSATVKY